MKYLAVILCLITSTIFSQTKTKKIEIYSSPTIEYVNANILIENDIEKDITIHFYGRDHQYTQITEFLTFYNGSPKDFFIFINKVKGVFNEEFDTTVTIDNVNITTQKMGGKKLLSISVKDKSGYRLFNQKGIDKIIEKFSLWAKEKSISIN